MLKATESNELAMRRKMIIEVTSERPSEVDLSS